MEMDLVEPREHVVCTTDEAIVCVDLESFQQRSSMALSERPGQLCVARDVAMVCAAKDASVIGYGIGARAVDLRSRVPERLGCVALSSDGYFVAGGGAGSGRVYLWELWSGRLCRVWEGHFRGVSCACFSERDDVLVTGGEDSIVAPWCATAAADSGQRTAPMAPLWDHWSEHSMPVTGLVCRGSRVFSVALDRTCKVRDLASGSALCSLSLGDAPRCLALDALDSYLLVGCDGGQVLRVDLDATAMAATCAAAADAAFDHRGARVGGGSGYGGDEGGAFAGLLAAQAPVLAYVGHSGRVVGVAQHPRDASRIVSASDDGSLRVWDAASRQCLRVVSLGPNSPPIRHLAALPDRPTFGGKPAVPMAAALKRDDAAPPDASLPAPLLRRGDGAASPAAPPAGGGGDDDGLRADLAAARDEAARWKSVADQLWREVEKEA